MEVLGIGWGGLGVRLAVAGGSLEDGFADVACDRYSFQGVEDFAHFFGGINHVFFVGGLFSSGARSCSSSLFLHRIAVTDCRLNVVVFHRVDLFCRCFRLCQ